MPQSSASVQTECGCCDDGDSVDVDAVVLASLMVGPNVIVLVSLIVQLVRWEGSCVCQIGSEIRSNCADSSIFWLETLERSS